MTATDHLSRAQFIMPIQHVLDMPSAEGQGIGAGRVRDVLPMKHAENERQLADGELFVQRRQAAVQKGRYKALRVNTKGQLRDGHHTLAMIQAAGHSTVRMQGGWRPWKDKEENEPDESYDLTQKARRKL